MSFAELPGGHVVNTQLVLALEPFSNGRTRLLLSGSPHGLVVAGDPRTVLKQLQAAEKGERIRGPQKTVVA